MKKVCFRCGSEVQKETELDYPYECLYCDENMYNFEVLEVPENEVVRTLEGVKAEIEAYNKL